MYEQYQGLNRSFSITGGSFSETFVGEAAEVEAKAAEYRSFINTFFESKGKLQAIRFTPAEGGLATLSLEYATTADERGGTISADGTPAGKKSQKLFTRNLSRNIESHPNYLSCWRYYLIGKVTPTEDFSEIVPSWYYSCKNQVVPRGDWENYRWVQNISEIPPKQSGDAEWWRVVDNGNICCAPVKPGVETFDWTIYEITETGKTSSAPKMGAELQQNVNKIIDPEFGRMGISGGDWKYDEAQGYFDGKNWVIDSRYSRSGDDLGWDKDIYSVGSR